MYNSLDKDMMEDLKYFGQYFEYYFENEDEKSFIENNFIIDYIENKIICYALNHKILRKLKLLSLNDDKTQFLIDKILKNSIKVDISEIIEKRLSKEISNGINKDIIKKLMGYIRETP